MIYNLRVKRRCVAFRELRLRFVASFRFFSLASQAFAKAATSVGLYPKARPYVRGAEELPATKYQNECCH